MSELTPQARAYIAALVIAAAGVTLAALRQVSALGADRLLLAAALTVLLAAAYLYPLPYGFRTRLHLDSSVVFAAVLLFEPGVAIAVAAAGVLLAEAIRREDWAQALFNAAQTALQAAAAAGLLALAGWDPTTFRPDHPLEWLALPVAGVAMHLVNTLAVAAMIGAQEGVSPRTVWRRSSANLGRPELLAHLAQLGLGLLAAAVAEATPWALALLILPAVAVHSALRQHERLRLRAEADLRESQADLGDAQRIAHLGGWAWELASGRHQWSDEVYRILGLEPGAVEPSLEAFLAAIHPDERVALRAGLDTAAEGDAPFNADLRLRRADGREAIVHTRGGVVRDPAGLPVRLVGTLHDVTERKELESRLAHLAFHDPLTGLPNRALFAERLEQALLRLGPDARGLAVLYLDLDRFKRVNDSWGHEAGDRLLVEAAHRLRGCVRPGDTVARLGGDEFTVLLDPGDGAVAAAAAERIIRAFEAPFALGAQDAFVATSVGVAPSGPGRATADGLLRAADDALYRAKQQGRARYVVFDPAAAADHADRLGLEADLRQALARDELRLFYQPTVELDSGRIVGLEAFVHWAHPDRGLLSPPAFVPLAEETGLILPIGRWALGEACRQGRAWRERYPANPPAVGVNLSSREFAHPDLVANVTAALRGSGLPPGSLELEIPEGVVMADAESSVAILWALAGLGVGVAIDDFGTGYSSLGQLSRFPLDALKLDRSFVDGLGRDAAASTIADAVVGLAHALGLRVVAEGIETREQLAVLRRLGCERGQGHHFARPLPAADLTELLAAGTLAAPGGNGRRAAAAAFPLDRAPVPPPPLEASVGKG